MNIPNTIKAAVLISVVALAALLVYELGGPDTATADDAAHTTSLTLGSAAFDPVGNPSGVQVPALLASITSTDSNDDAVDILLFETPPNSLENDLGWSRTDRNGANGLANVAEVELGLRPSGTTFRAVFTAYDASGAVTFSYQRIVTIP